MDIPIQIANNTSSIVVRADDPYNPLFYATIALAIFTGVLALVVFIGNLQTNRNTRKSLIQSAESNRLTQQSNDLIRTEIESTFRPMLSRHVYEKKEYNSNQWNDDTCSITPEKIMFHIINNGKLPAIEVSYQSYTEIRDVPSTIRKLDPIATIQTEPESSLAPMEYYSIDVPLRDPTMYNLARYNVKCYFGIIIFYLDENKRKYYYHMEGFFNKGALMLNHVDMGTLT